MSKKPRLREAVDKQHGTRAKALFKMSSQHIYHIYWTVPSQLSWKTSLWLTCKILGLLVNTLAADEMYPLLKRDNLTIPFQWQLSHKEETFSLFSAAFLKSRWNFEHFDKKDALIDFVISKLRTLKTYSDKCLKSPVSENPLTSNKVNVPSTVKICITASLSYSLITAKSIELKLSLSLTYQILGLLFNTSVADKLYPVLSRDHFTIPIQMKLSQK